VRAVAALLLQSSEAPAHILTSPLVRAVQTAEILAIVTELGDRRGSVRISDALSPGGDGLALAKRLAAEGLKRVALVGHEPDLSSLASSLLGTFERPFEKAMVVAIHLRPDHDVAKLRFVLEPKELRFDPPREGPG
jgi:phosphohistidine phosphatase